MVFDHHFDQCFSTLHTFGPLLSLSINHLTRQVNVSAVCDDCNPPMLVGLVHPVASSCHHPLAHFYKLDPNTDELLTLVQTPDKTYIPT